MMGQEIIMTPARLAAMIGGGRKEMPPGEHPPMGRNRGHTGNAKSSDGVVTVTAETLLQQLKNPPKPQTPIRTDGAGRPLTHQHVEKPEGAFRIERKDGYIYVYDLPIVDEHPVFSEDGQFVQQCDVELLNTICENNNRRVEETGDLVPITIGHTDDDSPEDEQPEIVGYARDFHIAPLFDTDRQAIFVTGRFPEAVEDTIRKYPRRSVELWLEGRDSVIDPIALLGATTPERDLGLLRLSKNGRRRDRYTMPRRPVRRAAQDWTKSTGERGGTMWTNRQTGETRYGEQNPGGQGGAAAPSQPGSPHQPSPNDQARIADLQAKMQQPGFAPAIKQQWQAEIQALQTGQKSPGTSAFVQGLAGMQGHPGNLPQAPKPGLAPPGGPATIAGVKMDYPGGPQAMTKPVNPVSEAAGQWLAQYYRSKGGGLSLELEDIINRSPDADTAVRAAFPQSGDKAPAARLIRQAYAAVQGQGAAQGQQAPAQQPTARPARKPPPARRQAASVAPDTSFPLATAATHQSTMMQRRRPRNFRHAKQEHSMADVSGSVASGSDDLVGRLVAALEELDWVKWCKAQMQADHMEHAEAEEEFHEMDSRRGRPVRREAMSFYDASKLRGVDNLDDEEEHLGENSPGVRESRQGREPWPMQDQLSEASGADGHIRHAREDHYDPDELWGESGGETESETITHIEGYQPEKPKSQPTVAAHKPEEEVSQAQYRRRGQPVRRAASGASGDPSGEVSGASGFSGDQSGMRHRRRRYAAAAAPSASNVYVPGEVSGDEADEFRNPPMHPAQGQIPKKGSRRRMSRVPHLSAEQESLSHAEWEAAERARMENQELHAKVARLERSQGLLIRNAKRAQYEKRMAERERELIQIQERERVELEVPEEMDRARTMTDQQWSDHVKCIRKRYSRSPGGAPWLPIEQGNAGPSAPRSLDKQGALDLAKQAMATDNPSAAFDALVQGGGRNGHQIERVN